MSSNKPNFFITFFIKSFSCIYKKLSKDSSANYYEDSKEKRKRKNDNIVVNDTKI